MINDVYLMLKDEFPSVTPSSFTIQKIVALKPQISRQQLLAAIVQNNGDRQYTPHKHQQTKKKNNGLA